MIIDCHGHYTTAPKALELFRKAQIAALTDPKAAARSIQISDDEVRETLVPAQLKLQQERARMSRSSRRAPARWRITSAPSRPAASGRGSATT
jgi:hypothetical protein